MNNEKNFLIAILITLGVLWVYPMVMKQFFPQFFPEPQTQAITQTPNNSLEKLEPSFLSESPTYYIEKSYVLENNRYKVEINSPGADIKRIELKETINPATKQPTILMDTKGVTAGIFSAQDLLKDLKLEDVNLQGNTIVFQYLHSSGIGIKKKIYIEDKMYKIAMELEFQNNAQEEKHAAYSLRAGEIAQTTTAEDRLNNIEAMFTDNKVYKKGIGGIKEETVARGQIKFAGIGMKYFSLITVPFAQSNTLQIAKQPLKEGQGLVTIDLRIDQFNIPANSSVRQQFALYAGPNDHNEMAALGLGVEDVRGKGFFASFGDFLLLLLRFLFKIFKNYGLAVIVLGIVINLFLYPLTFKSLKSMKEMQALQPLVENLRVEYKDNAPKLNKEIMGLYKKHKVNPAGGCLPMLFQMPVFFSLYNVLMRAIELRGASFLWIKDLSSPDALIMFNRQYPFVGSSFNLLPLLMVLITVVQQKISSPTINNEQQKMMAFMMPLFLGFVFYNFPAGLVLYFLTNTIFSFVIQAKLLANTNAG